MNKESLHDLGPSVFRLLEDGMQDTRPGPGLRETGIVRAVSRGIAQVSGLSGVIDQELIRFSDGLVGLAVDLEETAIGVALLGDHTKLEAGQPAWRTSRAIEVPVGPALLGRIVDGIGRPIDQRGEIRAEAYWPVERPAAPIVARAPVARPLHTGIKAIDAAIPVGRGQRQLILGDRQTGKTSIAVDTLLNQRGTGVIGVYCAIGQRAAGVARVIATLRRHAMLDQCVVVVAGPEDAPGQQFLAPYAATSIAEYFMAQGRDVLIVHDDLTRHARTWRELSLLLRRPPGREAYPGDIFFVHARLLERATRLHDDHGGGSLTALPIVETQAQNLSAYIPTNLISITDGQIYLSPELFHKGQLPAIDIGKSVSRVGGRAQLPAWRSIAGDLRLFYAQFEEFEAFARFGTQLDAGTRQALERGRRVREILRQDENAPLAPGSQIGLLLATIRGWLDEVPVTSLAAAEAAIVERIVRELPEWCRRIEDGQPLTGDDSARLQAVVADSVRALPHTGHAEPS